jgi:ABC-type branched-subunit amino acid transport system ATPase component
MGDSRHKRRYKPGETTDRMQMTDTWKQRVRDRLKENERNDVYPRNQVELADAVGASDKSAITKMLKASASKLVPEICRVLQITTPMQERREPDALDRVIDGMDQATRDAFAEVIARLRPR